MQRTKLEIPFGHVFDKPEVSSPKALCARASRAVCGRPSRSARVLGVPGGRRKACGSSIKCRLAIARLSPLPRRCRHNRMVAPLLIDGAMNGATFRAYIEQFVVPILKRNDIVAIDNLPAHSVDGIEETINVVGATLRYLPKYSPDLNPI